MLFVLLPLLGYLLGSLSSAVLVSRTLGLADPRTTGSRNPGATNVLRIGGKRAAVLTLAGDVLKGVVAVVIARFVTNDPTVLASTALAAFLGHLYPVFFGFRGGKGVATALGVWLALVPVAGALMLATWLLVALVFRYSSLAALIAAFMAPLYIWWLVPFAAYVVVAVAMTALLIWRHRSNIRNLWIGTETKIGAAKPARAP
ncbi:MAG: glycerol-3-phosphate 1-O-acyltransferase PlsY [Gammaproteobacteria bacterium]